MKNLLYSISLLGACFFFCSASCVNDFSTAWNLEEDRFIAALNACYLLPGGGEGCQNHAYETNDRNLQDIENDYNCCEFNDC